MIEPKGNKNRLYYFAYGSNLSRAQMRERCPGARFLDAALLEGYEQVFDGYSEHWRCATANIVPAKSKRVTGGVYEISPEDLKKLDEYEVNYHRLDVSVKMDHDGTIKKAVAYNREPRELGEPSEQYLSVMAQGRRDFDLFEMDPRLRSNEVKEYHVLRAVKTGLGFVYPHPINMKLRPDGIAFTDRNGRVLFACKFDDMKEAAFDWSGYWSFKSNDRQRFTTMTHGIWNFNNIFNWGVRKTDVNERLETYLAAAHVPKGWPSYSIVKRKDTLLDKFIASRAHRS
jgi:gamma-glutamylcyclotransferase (GGCT)/AIG2-like uncharacterized protein YtfP